MLASHHVVVPQPSAPRYLALSRTTMMSISKELAPKASLIQLRLHAMGTALLTDRYELTMLQAALNSGAADRRCVFEVFTRRLSQGRRYGVVAGTGRLAEKLRDFRFREEELTWLDTAAVVDKHTLAWLANYRFTGSIYGYAEGEMYFPGSPILTVEGTFAEAVVLETLVLSVLNHDSAIASAASRMVTAAGGRPCLEMGSRRTHEEAAIAAARAAAITGFAGTSNLEAGRQYGLATIGTAAHAFTLLHDGEHEAFDAQIASLGSPTTLLVDTYTVRDAVRAAVAAAGPELGAVRIDSGDLLGQAYEVRALLDELGATQTEIVVTSDLDEHAIAALAAAPVDSYGVGTSLVTGSGAPTAGFVYKLVAREDGAGNMIPVAKASVDKTSIGGRKRAFRRIGPDRRANAEIVVAGDKAALESETYRDLLVPLVVNGQVGEHLSGTSGLDAARARHDASLKELPSMALRLQKGDPVLPTLHI